MVYDTIRPWLVLTSSLTCKWHRFGNTRKVAFGPLVSEMVTVAGDVSQPSLPTGKSPERLQMNLRGPVGTSAPCTTSRRDYEVFRKSSPANRSLGNPWLRSVRSGWKKNSPVYRSLPTGFTVKRLRRFSIISSIVAKSR